MRHLVFRIENYIPLIRKVSNKHWKKLPGQVQSWLSPEDYTQEGIVFVRYHLMPRYDPAIRAKAKFSTYIFVAVNRHFSAIRESLTCEKRWQTGDAIEVLLRANKTKEELYVSGMDGMDCLVKMYEEVSPCLQRHMDQWFFNQDGPPKVLKHSAMFQKARAEFLEVAPRFGVTIEVVSDVIQATRMSVFEPELLAPQFGRQERR